jgi:CBS domain-containing protein
VRIAFFPNSYLSRRGLTSGRTAQHGGHAQALPTEPRDDDHPGVSPMEGAMKLRSVLNAKTRKGVVTIEDSATMATVVATLVSNNIGALVVLSSDGPVGIVTERDVLRQVASHGGEFLTKSVAEVMTKDLVIGTLDDDIEVAKRVMTEKRFRHLPIMDAGRLTAILSLGDIVRALCSDAQTEARYLRDYIAGHYR